MPEIDITMRDGGEARSVVVDPADAARVVRPTSLELLETIAREEPGSIRETARIVDRDVRQVHENLWTLGELGVVSFDRTGRAHRPIVAYDRLDVSIEW